ncbi:hypothetical protein NC653_021742 [Populus alba x Populus x berolinensis]|uniref:Uncharacterized protein n=1 Tax=Populus alba x Populus x berolinensis TaxID=444605 RepID=A0AAD6MNN6_9ROSI|nr:hypothetical protein NC653_021742 [Populus alba x Populus x berolinensis]
MLTFGQLLHLQCGENYRRRIGTSFKHTSIQFIRGLSQAGAYIIEGAEIDKENIKLKVVVVVVVGLANTSLSGGTRVEKQYL